MTIEDELAALRAEVRYLTDRQDVLDCVMNQSRGHGDVAHAESYVIGTMRVRDHRTVALIGGRYLDRLERRDGVWKIALRRCTIEWTMNGDTSAISQGGFAGFIKGAWGTDDLSYARPMDLDTPAERW